jgi:hypothetical protein
MPACSLVERYQRFWGTYLLPPSSLYNNDRSEMRARKSPAVEGEWPVVVRLLLVEEEAPF